MRNTAPSKPFFFSMFELKEKCQCKDGQDLAEINLINIATGQEEFPPSGTL